MPPTSLTHLRANLAAVRIPLGRGDKGWLGFEEGDPERSKRLRDSSHAYRYAIALFSEVTRRGLFSWRGDQSIIFKICSLLKAVTKTDVPSKGPDCSHDNKSIHDDYTNHRVKHLDLS